MNAAIARTVGLVLETYLANRAVLRLERRDNVLLAEAQRNQPKLRVFRRQRLCVSRIRHEEPTRSTQRRLSMAGEALIGVVAGAQSIGIGVQLREGRIELAEARDRRALRHIGTNVTGGLQLPGAQHAFQERSQLIGIDRCSRRRILADDRRMWNGDAVLL